MSWNRVSDEAIQIQPDTLSRQRQRQQGLRSGVAAVTVFLGTYFRHLVLSEEWHDQIGFVGQTLFAVLLISCLSKLYSSSKPRQQATWEKELSGRQRQLYGLSSGSSAPVQSSQRAVPTRRSTLTPLGVPERNAKPITPRSAQGLRGHVGTPQSLQSLEKRRASPFSSTPPVITPEQLKPYLVPFEVPSVSPGGERDKSLKHDTRSHTPLFASTEESIQHYRPSLQLRSHTASPLRADAALYPSSTETYTAVLARLGTDPHTMETWTDRLREWLAAEVFKPLHLRMANIHQEVSTSASQLGGSRFELSSLAAEEPAGGPGFEADEEAQLAGLSGTLQNALRGNLNDAQRQAVVSCLQAVQTYQGLSKLLKGEFPANVLAPVPRGYIASRVKQLAQGPCLKEFTWNAGGVWRGRPWSSDLLTDSALVFYIFAAYLQAPGWDFSVDVEAARNVAAPLYVGSLPTRPASGCTALLPVRPAALPPDSTAILALGLASPKPQFTLVLACKPALTMCEYRAVFCEILLLLQHCKLNNFSMIGNNSLKFLKLERVLRPPDTLLDVLRNKWFAF